MIDSITIDGVTIELTDDCPECIKHSFEFTDICNICEGSVKIPLHITPAQFKEKTGEELPDWRPE